MLLFRNFIHTMSQDYVNYGSAPPNLISIILLQLIYKHLLVIIQEQMAICIYTHFQKRHLSKLLEILSTKGINFKFRRIQITK